MSNHYTADGSISIYDDGAEYTGPVVTSTRPSPAPRSSRDEILDDLQSLLDMLRANPDIIIDRHSARISYIALSDDDEKALAEIAGIAEAAGVAVTAVGGKPVQADTTHHYATVRRGVASYEAACIVRPHTATPAGETDA